MRINRRSFLRTVGLGTAALAMPTSLTSGQTRKRKPNILIVIADDMACHDCGAYGSKEVRTPNIDRLAGEGMTFDRAFTATAMCAPTRQQLYTGIFPVRNGAYPNHSRVKTGTKSMVHHFRALGYRVGLTGKTHFGPKESFPFEKGNEAFVSANKDEPFCLIVASHHPHTPWKSGGGYDPANLTIPPYLVDNPETRRALAAYYGEITAFDEQAGHWMEVIDEAGLSENTIFIVTSEQGPQFPGGKWTCYDLGLQVAFIVRWPAKVNAGLRTKAMIQYVDVVPTLVEAAGAEPTNVDTNCPDPAGNRGFDGKSFLNALLGKTDEHNKYVYGVHTTLGIISGKPYPIRSIRSTRHKYIVNLMPDATFQNVVTEQDREGYWKTWLRDAAKDERAAELSKRYTQRPAEELYDLAKDPWELDNLASDPEYGKIKRALRKELKVWMAQQGDRGIETEMQAKTRQGRRKAKQKDRQTKNVTQPKRRR